MGHPWPLFDLRLRTPGLELRLPTDDEGVDRCRGLFGERDLAPDAWATC
jgi:hypothetical protein